jgi:hypothetical protein
MDTVRGLSNVWHSNDTNTETTYSSPTGNSVAWVANLSKAAVSNTAGSITTTLSANATAGMSCFTCTLPASGTVTVGHGLGAIPTLAIFVARNSSGQGKMIYHKDVGNPYLQLQFTNGSASSGPWAAGAPDSSIFTLNAAWWSVSNLDLVVYAFTDIVGFSKFGSYTGNNSADGPFVYCGFKPRFVMIKDVTSAYSWVIYDTARQTYNGADVILLADLNNSEQVGSGNPIDLLSNGFKIKTTSPSENKSGDTYIFAAFAEAPFKYATAR